MARWHRWKYKNLTFLLASILFALFISTYEPFHAFLLSFGNLGYISTFIAGILFVSTFTVATGAVMLLILAESFSPIEICVIAGLGAVVGDFVIFRFIKDDLAREVLDIYNHIDGDHHIQKIFHSKYFSQKIFHSKYFSWTLPVIGAIIIATPFPDEIGVSLMGISKMKTYQFLLISFILNTIGIFLVITASLIMKP